MFCTNCGTKNSEVGVFCTNCGERFEQASGVVAQETPSQTIEKPAASMPIMFSHGDPTIAPLMFNPTVKAKSPQTVKNQLHQAQQSEGQQTDGGLPPWHKPKSNQNEVVSQNEAASKSHRIFYRELFTKLEEANYISHELCTSEEAEEYQYMTSENLPKGVFRKTVDGKSTLFKYPVLPPEDLQTYISLASAKNIKTIKNCVVFLTVLVIASLALSLWPFIAILLAFL